MREQEWLGWPWSSRGLPSVARGQVVEEEGEEKSEEAKDSAESRQRKRGRKRGREGEKEINRRHTRARKGEWRSGEKELGGEGQNKQINVRVACLLLGGDTVTTPLSSTPSERYVAPLPPPPVPPPSTPLLALVSPPHPFQPFGWNTVVEMTSATPDAGHATGCSRCPKPPRTIAREATCPLAFKFAHLSRRAHAHPEQVTARKDPAAGSQRSDYRCTIVYFR